jgi:hypothetical protein
MTIDVCKGLSLIAVTALSFAIIPETASARRAASPCTAVGGNLLTPQQTNATLCWRFLKTFHEDWPVDKPLPYPLKINIVIEKPNRVVASANFSQNGKAAKPTRIKTGTIIRPVDLTDMDQLGRMMAEKLSKR